MAIVQTAYEANPNNLMIVLRSAVAHLHCGDLDITMDCAQRAMRLSPGDFGSHIALCLIADVHLIRGEFDSAIDWATLSLAVNANFGPSLWVLIAANALLDRMDAAHRLLRQYEASAPAVTIRKLQAAQPNKLPERTANIFVGLRLAGMSD